MKKTVLILVILSLLSMLSIQSIPAIAQPPVQCGSNANIRNILDQVSEASVAKWIRDLSGENAVLIDGQNHLIRTRYTSELFNPSNQYAKAYPYLTQELIGFGYVHGVNLQDHNYAFKNMHRSIWTNPFRIQNR